MPDLDARLPGVTARAQRLQIRQVEGRFLGLAHRADMIDLKPVPVPTGDTAEAVAPLGRQPQDRPPGIPVDVGAVPWVL